MHRRIIQFAATVGAFLSLATFAASPVAADPAPWWQVLTGSRPTNLWKPSDNVQELKTENGPFGAAIRVSVEGKAIACLGDGLAAKFCGPGTGFEPIDDASELEAVLEIAFGTNSVEVSGGPVGGQPFIVTTPGRSAPTIGAAPLLSGGNAGNATEKILSNGGSGRLVVIVTNLGDAPANGTGTPVVVIDKLPAGIEATGVEAFAGLQGEAGPVSCSIPAADEVSCSFNGELPSYQAIEIEILANLTGNPPVQGAAGRVSVSGGNAPSDSAVQMVQVSPEPTSFGLEHFSSQPEEEGGGPARNAGAHPFQLTTTVQLKAGSVSPGSDRNKTTVEQPRMPRNLRFPLPPGLVGNAAETPQCPIEKFLNGKIATECPDASAIGVAAVTIIERQNLGLVRQAVPVFNLPPAHGEPARFGFAPVGTPVMVGTEVNPEDDYRIVASVRNVTQVAQFLSSTLVLWGSPGDPRHDAARGEFCVNRVARSAFGGFCQPGPGQTQVPYLRLPVSCDGPLDFDAEFEPWNLPTGSIVEHSSFASAEQTACNQVPFDPRIAASPTSKLAENPTGLDFRLDMANSGLSDSGAIAEGQAKKVEVTLPVGMTINPSQAEGLAVCSPAQYAREHHDSAPGEGCPNASKIGEVQVSTPLLKEEARGALYVAAPYDNPFGSLIGVYVVARIPERGILIKQPGKVVPDQKTGQLVTTFDDLPQLPFSTFKLHFREGGRAPLVTPPTCGTFQTVARFVPWSAVDPYNPLPSEIITRVSSARIDRGPSGGVCPSGNPPFAPGFEAGSMNNAAGRYSPFYMRLTRRDGDQDLTKFSSILPEGALAKLAAVTRCPQASVEAAKGKRGLDEKGAPSCPASSQIGRTSVGAGVGSILTYVPGQLYLGGPYHGAPLSVVSITPAVAGPFDLGTVVVQEGLKLDPATGEVHVDGDASDPIPHILQGIPLKVRDLRVYVDRDKFTTTPTSCDPMATRATLFGSGLDVFSPGDDVAANLSARYQAASCERLGFKPRLKLRLSGKRSTRGANPALRAVLRPRANDANPDRISVTLPGSELLEQSHIRTICTRVQFAAKGGFGGGCPVGSVYGHVRAWTPLLDQPLEGPVYLRSSDHELPDLVLALHGLVDIESVGRIDSTHARLRTTFENIPDAPLSKVVLQMQGGRKGLLVNSTDICRGVHRARAAFTGQNGKRYGANPKVAAKCGSKKHRKK
jgi:hypothetical protein